MADTNTYDLFQKVEKWTTKEKFNALDLSTIETGTEYNLAGAIEESDLDVDLQTKINGKLTAPTTPTADSAVTMLADGTVGTKPLSEFTKVYRYDIELQYVEVGGDTWFCDIYIYDTEEIKTFTIDMLKPKLPNTTDGVLNNSVGWGFFGVFYYKSNKLQFHGNSIDNEVTPVSQNYYLEIDINACTINRVTKTEL